MKQKKDREAIQREKVKSKKKDRETIQRQKV
jgi:hypothetical protein